MQWKTLGAGIVVFILISSTIPSLSANSNIYSTITIPESHLIQGVKYVPQNAGIYCLYADITMVLKYLGFDTSLEDILFYDGLGYFYTYDPLIERLPKEGCYVNFSFVFDLFGVNVTDWYPDEYITKKVRWDKYYERLRTNLSEDKPVITGVDPFSMSSLRNQFMVTDFLWDRLLNPGHHHVLIIGYNNSNQTVCYMDPNAGLYGDESFGNYTWMSVNNLKTAVEKNVWPNYKIMTIEKKSNPLTKEERFVKTLEANVKKFEGNYSNLFNYHGIKALKMMKNDFSKGLNSRLKTILIYKKYGKAGISFTFLELYYKLLSTLFPNKSTIFNFYKVGNENPFERIADEKKQTADYLEKSNFYSEFSNNQSNLLRKEIRLWFNLSDYYKIFMRRGVFLSLFRANILLEKMENSIDEIIIIEQKLIDELNDFLSTENDIN